MPSKKRAKGKERKLKQQARQSVSSSSPSSAVGGDISQPEQNIPRVAVAKIHTECLHDALIPPRGHPVNYFINTFHEGCAPKDVNIADDITIVDVVYETFEKHRDVWKDSTLRKMAINIMLRIGTNAIIDERNLFARLHCIAIVFLENYDGEGTFNSVLSKATEDVGYLSHAEERDVIHFYKKRIPCSCLNKLHSEIKKIQVRGSRCNHCRQTVKRIDLKTCSRCKSAQYCSKECQKLAWPSHKEKCKMMANIVHKERDIIYYAIKKRAKGKERKLKQQAREPVERRNSQPPPNGENINLTEQNIRRIEQEAENVRCYHGGYKHKIVPGLSANDFIDSIPRGHPVTAFTETFIETMTCENCHAVRLDSLKMTFEKHQEVWKDDAMRKMTIDRMVSIGTDSIIDECNVGAKRISEAIIYLENYDGEGTFTSMLSKGTEEVVYLLRAELREVVHFYKKRIPCSCLDKLYSEIKKCQVRGSQWCHCKQTIKSKDLKTCSRCKSSQYCSKECQKLAWPSHKEQCKVICPIHESVKKVETTRRNEE